MRFDSAIGDAVRAMKIGDTRAFPVPPDRTAHELRLRLSVWAIRAWGSGSYSTTIAADEVQVTRLPLRHAEPSRATPPPQDAERLPASVPLGGMDRKQAAAWLARYIPGGVTADQLKRLDAKGHGPRRYRVGRASVYFATDLDLWLRVRFRLVEPS